MISGIACAIALLAMAVGTKRVSPLGYRASTIFPPSRTRSVGLQQTSSSKSESLRPEDPALCDRRRTIKSVAAVALAFGLAERPANGEVDLQDGLKTPTPSKPQIQLPDNASQQEGTLEGLVYLKNPQSDRRPISTDLLFITVRPIDEPTRILGGATIPFSSSRSFSFSFVMNEKNSQSSATWMEYLNSKDLLVEAVVCSRDLLEEAEDKKSTLVLCEQQGRPMKASAISKLVQLDRQGAGPINIRAATSLALE